MKGDGGLNALRLPMKATDTVICRCKNCLHEHKEIKREDAVKKGNSYYHQDCLQTQNDIKQVIELFKEHINPNPVYAQLNAVINNIVYARKIGSDFLLYGLKYYISNKIKLNYPQGLYYVIQNKNVLNSYNKEKSKKVVSSIEITEESETNFSHVARKATSFSDILK